MLTASLRSFNFVRGGGSVAPAPVFHPQPELQNLEAVFLPTYRK